MHGTVGRVFKDEGQQRSDDRLIFNIKDYDADMLP
jgi:hypothetical protein